METLQEAPSPAKQAELEAKKAQDQVQDHAEALKGLASQSDRSSEDEATLRDWTAEGQQLRKEAVTKADEASLKNPVGTVKVGPSWEVLTPHDVEHELAYRADNGRPSDDRSHKDSG